MQTKPITRAQKTLEGAGFSREQSMATVEAIAEMQQPLLEAIGKLDDKLDSIRIEMLQRDVKLAKRDTWLVVTGIAVAFSIFGMLVRLMLNTG